MLSAQNVMERLLLKINMFLRMSSAVCKLFNSAIFIKYSAISSLRSAFFNECRYNYCRHAFASQFSALIQIFWYITFTIKFRQKSDQVRWIVMKKKNNT